MDDFGKAFHYILIGALVVLLAGCGRVSRDEFERERVRRSDAEEALDVMSEELRTVTRDLERARTRVAQLEDERRARNVTMFHLEEEIARLREEGGERETAEVRRFERRLDDPEVQERLQEMRSSFEEAMSDPEVQERLREFRERLEATDWNEVRERMRQERLERRREQ